MHTSLNGDTRSSLAKVDQLVAEITCLERRLRSMGGDGDCAYERSMSRLYRDMVRQRRLELASLGRV